MEQLVVPQRLGDGVDHVEVGHLLVPDLGVEPDHVGVVERVDERQRMADGRQEDVAARLVRLRLEGEADVVAAVEGVAAQRVERLAVAVQRGADVLGHVHLGALAAAPEHVGVGAELGGEVEVAHHLAQREPADLAVVGGERALLEHRVEEQVGGDHRHDQPGLVQRAAQPLEAALPLGLAHLERHDVVVVERDAPRAQLGQAVHGAHRIERRPGGVTERIAGLPADRPQAERELVCRTRRRHHLLTSSFSVPATCRR